jgi:hypothetical protein
MFLALSRAFTITATNFFLHHFSFFRLILEPSFAPSLSNQLFALFLLLHLNQAFLAKPFVFWDRLKTATVSVTNVKITLVTDQ